MGLTCQLCDFCIVILQIVCKKKKKKKKHNSFWEEITCGVPRRSILRPLLLDILSVSLSESFLGIGSLGFSETQHGIRGRCSVERDRAIFFIYFFPQKWTKNRVF